MGDEQGDRSTPLLVYWIIYQSEQLGEVGVSWRRDSRKAHTGEEVRVVTCRFPKIEGKTGFLEE